MSNSQRTTNHTPSKEHLSDEIKFLIACCQVEPSEKDISFIFSYLNAEHLTLDTLISLANQHGILPLVYKTLKNLKPVILDSIGEPQSLLTLLTNLKSTYTQISQRNMLMSAELIRIMKLLEENGIKALAFKGPTLAQMAYGDITLRQYGDLDILVDKQVVAKAGDIMVANGFEPIHSMKILTNPICLELDKDFSFFSPGQVHVEMHWRLVPKGLNTYFDFDKLIQEKQSVFINGKTVYTPSSEHLLTYLCIHGSKHAWERIEWICDIDRLIQNHDLDWDKVLTYTKSKNDRRPLLLGLLLSQKLFQTPLPNTIIKMMETEPHLNELTMEVISFFNDALLSNSDLQRIYLIESFVAKVFHEKQNKKITFLKQLFKVSRRDCQYFVLPEKLKFFYIFLRPFRLIYTRLNYSDK